MNALVKDLDVPKATLMFIVIVVLSAGAWSIFTFIYPPSSPSIPANVTAKEAPANPSPPAIEVRFCYGELRNVCESKVLA
jgi:hypothetical protein